MVLAIILAALLQVLAVKGMNKPLILRKAPGLKVLFCLLILALSINHTQAQGGSELFIDVSEEGTVKGSSYGEELLEMKGYPLLEILYKIDPNGSYEIKSEELSTKRFDFKYVGDLSFRDRILEDLNFAIKLNLDISIKTRKDQPDVYKLQYNGIVGCEKEGTINNISQLNRVWKGSCVQLSEVAKKIHDWYALNIEVEENVILPSVELYHDNFDAFELYLKQAQINLEQINTTKSKTIYTYE